MTERQKQSAFLKELLSTGDTDQHRQLQARMAAIERDVRSMRYACRMVGLAALFSVTGLGYCAVLLPDYFDSSTPITVRLLRALTLGCVLSYLGFWVMSWWYRGLLYRLHDEARALLTHLMHRHPTPASSASALVVVHKGDTAMYENKTRSFPAVTTTDFVALNEQGASLTPDEYVTTKPV